MRIKTTITMVQIDSFSPLFALVKLTGEGKQSYCFHSVFFSCNLESPLFFLEKDKRRILEGKYKEKVVQGVLTLRQIKVSDYCFFLYVKSTILLSHTLFNPHMLLLGKKKQKHKGI